MKGESEQLSQREKKKKKNFVLNFSAPKQWSTYTKAWLQSYAEVPKISENKNHGISECFESATYLISLLNPKRNFNSYFNYLCSYKLKIIECIF